MQSCWRAAACTTPCTTASSLKPSVPRVEARDLARTRRLHRQPDTPGRGAATDVKLLARHGMYYSLYNSQFTEAVGAPS